MKKALDVMSDLGSVILAAGLFFYFKYFPGHAPSTTGGTLFGVGIAGGFAILYGILEALPVIRKETPTPIYLAFETFVSYIPMFAFCVIGTLWATGQIVISSFQWIVAGIFLTAILLDLFGFLAVMAQRLLLTDELKNVH
ncbi:MAG: hypothetical protein WAX57_02345 [Minisyncoccia bacterium]